MKKLFIILLLLNFGLFAQTSHSGIDFNCSLCHSCEKPTKLDPCLKPCPRIEIITVHHTAAEAPKYIMLDKFKDVEDNFAPVNFSHKAHAEMSVMSGGCEMCHHYNPPGRVVGCSECHNVKRSREELRLPDLKGALHRQCIDCHKLWKSDVVCADCHPKKSDSKVKPTTIDKYHPEIETPTRLVYETKEIDGFVTFYHNDHVNVFKLECSSCHKQESCARCHMEEAMLKNIKISDEAKHSSCSGCHTVDDNCESCHKSEVAPAFNHAISTRFDLNKYHSKIKCESCHKKPNSFTGLKSGCYNCHKNWSADNFNHSVTGLKLDEIHSELECTDCHLNNNYSKPECSNCHDEDVKYPEFVPGIKK